MLFVRKSKETANIFLPFHDPYLLSGEGCFPSYSLETDFPVRQPILASIFRLVQRVFFLNSVVATRWDTFPNTLGHVSQHVGTPFPTRWCNKKLKEKTIIEQKRHVPETVLLVKKKLNNVNYRGGK